MGRRSQAAEKKQQIVAAFCDCVIDLGIEGATMGEVASRLGLDRSTLHYYFRTREELIAEATQQTALYYANFIADTVSKISPNDRARSLVELLFGPNFHDSRRSRLLSEIEAQGRTDAFYTEQVKTVYKRSEAAISQVLEESFPNCPAKERKTVSWAMLQMCEGATVFMELGFGSAPRLAARQMAFTMLTHLENASASPD